MINNNVNNNNEECNINDVIEILNSGSFDAEKFAYLALTSKVENPIRDEVCYLLHKLYAGKNENKYFVAREWNKNRKKSDLAVLEWSGNKLEPKLIIEFKNCYSFDFFTEGRRKTFQNALKDDFKKADNIVKEVNNNIKCYAILIVTYIDSEIPENLNSIIKYATSNNPIIKRIEKNYKTDNKQGDKAKSIKNTYNGQYETNKNVFFNALKKNSIEKIDLKENVIIPPNSAYDIECSLKYYIFEKAG